MFHRLLIANRGEIALRILRACREIGIETVAVYSQADRDLIHLDYADQTFCVSRTDYLDMAGLLMTARLTDCDAVHPGYGFLAENAEFASSVEDEGLVWVGPDASLISLMGDKASARRSVSSHGLTAVPGSEAEIGEASEAARIAGDLGYPVALKASYGGGGRGIRIVRDDNELLRVFEMVQNEARALFGRSALYVEKFLEKPRHIEIQIMGDGRGNAIHLGSRECSVQRRHQKVIEEAPAPGIGARLLDELAGASAEAAAAMKYRNAGTFEFLYHDGSFYFIEMNTRIQVEHPVTEMITGHDLVKMQLQVAMTGELPASQRSVNFSGHSIECRINAEDEDHQPSPGRISRHVMPGGPGIRVDSHLYDGYCVPHQYDSLIGKLVSYGSDREEAIARMNRALHELRLEGIQTNVDLHKRILADEEFKRARFDTGFLERIVPS